MVLSALPPQGLSGKGYKVFSATDPLSTYETSLASLTGTLNWFCETMASGRSRLGSLYTLNKFGSRTHSHIIEEVVADLE